MRNRRWSPDPGGAHWGTNAEQVASRIASRIASRKTFKSSEFVVTAAYSVPDRRSKPKPVRDKAEPTFTPFGSGYA